MYAVSYAGRMSAVASARELSEQPQPVGMFSWFFCLEKIAGQFKLRPINARYMHQKEIDHYEHEK